VRWSLDGVGTIVVNFASNPEGRGGDVIAECIGVAEAIPEGLQIARRGGAYFVAGAFADVGDIPIKPRQHVLANPICLFGMINDPSRSTPSREVRAARCARRPFGSA
jgi:threonine dehydrogenase-like Zn-dependent dehydrogenase